MFYCFPVTISVSGTELIRIVLNSLTNKRPDEEFCDYVQHYDSLT